MIELEGTDGPLFINPKMVTSLRQADMVIPTGKVESVEQVEISLMGTFVYALGRVEDVLEAIK